MVRCLTKYATTTGMPHPPIYIDKVCFKSLLLKLSNQQCSETIGHAADNALFEQDKWLENSAVFTHITPQSGRWHVNLVFACSQTPLKLIQRNITSCPTLQKAQTTGYYMRRTADKDPRGTMTVPAYAYIMGHN